jgi:hypothetical protein
MKRVLLVVAVFVSGFIGQRDCEGQIPNLDYFGNNYDTDIFINGMECIPYNPDDPIAATYYGSGTVNFGGVMTFFIHIRIVNGDDTAEILDSRTNGFLVNQFSTVTDDVVASTTVPAANSPATYCVYYRISDGAVTLDEGLQVLVKSN